MMMAAEASRRIIGDPNARVPVIGGGGQELCHCLNRMPELARALRGINGFPCHNGGTRFKQCTVLTLLLRSINLRGLVCRTPACPLASQRLRCEDRGANDLR